MKKCSFILLFLAQICFSQVQFETKVSKTKLGLNERLQVDFTMNIDGDNFVTPNFEGFKLVGGPNQQISQQWVNGRGTFSKTYSYILLPSQKGVLTIKSATIEYNNQIYKTTPIKITVTNAVEIPKEPGEFVPPSADNAIHLVAEVSKQNPYINEPITVVYKLYFSNNIGISNSQEQEKPTYNNFWSHNIEVKKFEESQTTYNGEKCRMVVLKKVVLYPQKSGKLNIEPLSMNFTIMMPTGRRNIFGEAQIVEVDKNLSTGIKTIAVKPLPEVGKPIDFSGAVGSFSFSAVPNKTKLKHNESMDLVVKVTGSGNFKLFSLPKPIVPTALELYDPVHDEKFSTTLSGSSGAVLDRYAIIPQFKGDYAIKPLSFSYFDLKSDSYKTITAPEIVVNVIDGPQEAVVSKVITDKKNGITKQFEDIKLKTELVSSESNDFLGSSLFYTLLLSPFFGVPLLILLRRRKEAISNDVFGNRVKQNSRLAKKYLSEAKKQQANKEQFYIALERAMHNFLKAKLFIETSEMNKDKIAELLLSKNVVSTTIQDFVSVTENCEIARYAPTTATTIKDDFNKAVNVIADLEKQL